MKKIILLFVLLLSMGSLCMAQGSVDVLYLKDGSVIRGQVLEVIPEKTIKIRTYDGSVFVYSIDLVEKISVDDSITENTSKRSNYASSSYSTNSGYTPLRGYKGFVDVGYSIGTGDYDFDRVEISTTHGYQFNDFLFVGGGMGMHYYSDLDDEYAVPVFANFRANFMRGKVVPFGDVKLGYTVGDIVEGAYGAIGVGVRFALKGKKALNLSLSYTAQDVDVDYYGYYDYYYSDEETLGAFSIKIGFEF